MNTRKNQILSLLIVGALTTIGIGATEASAQVVLSPVPVAVIPVDIKAKLAHPALASPLFLRGTANVRVVRGTINLGTYFMTSPRGKAKIRWYPATVSPNGSFTAYGSGKAKVINPLTGAIERVTFRMVTSGRTDSVARALGRFKDVCTSVAGAGLKGKYHH